MLVRLHLDGQNMGRGEIMLVSLHLDGQKKKWDSPSDVGRWRNRDRQTDIGIPARPSFFLALKFTKPSSFLFSFRNSTKNIYELSIFDLDLNPYTRIC
jgi:hypothetical protein